MQGRAPRGCQRPAARPARREREVHRGHREDDLDLLPDEAVEGRGIGLGLGRTTRNERKRLELLVSDRRSEDLPEALGDVFAGDGGLQFAAPTGPKP